MTLKALLVGINYSSKSYLRLSGCINDVHAAREYLLEKHSAKPENIKVLVDDGQQLLQQQQQQQQGQQQSQQQGQQQGQLQQLWPTRKNLVDSLIALLKSSQAGDVILFHYSGHGTQVVDTDGTTHEALVPVDVKDVGGKFSNLIHDSELEKIILDNTPAKVTLYLILDCCYGGGDIEKLGVRIRSVLLPHKALGSLTRVAIPRSLPKNQLSSTPTPSPTTSEASRTIISMLRGVTDKKEITIVAYAGGSKFEPVADATFNYKSFGAFSYFLYNTLQLNKPLQNIKIIDTVKDSIKRSNFNQSPQLIASKVEQSKWSFLTHQEGDANATVVMLRDLVAITGANDIRDLNDKEIEELHLLDAAATLEVSQEVTWHSRKRGRVPFVAQDIARVIAGISGRAVLKIAQNQGLEENAAFSAASLAIRETTHMIFEQLLPIPAAGKRSTVKQPDLYTLIDSTVVPAIDQVLREYLPEVKKEFVERATANSTAVSLPNINAALAQPVDLSMQLADLCSQITHKSTNHLPETNKLVAHSIELVKQVVSAIAASDIYRQDSNRKLPSFPEMAKEISSRIESKCTDTFISQLSSSLIPQAEVEKLALGVVRDIVKDRVTVVDQDLEDRVREVTIRFGNFTSLVAPIGETLLSTLASHNAPIALVESFVGSMCKIAVDDVITGLTTTENTWGKFFATTKVPLLFKVTAKAVAEVAAHSVLDVLKTGNTATLNSGMLAGIVNVVAKNSAMKVLELLSNIIDKTSPTGFKMNGLGKGKVGPTFFNVLYSLAHIAVQASTDAMNSLSLSPEYRNVGEVDYATQQALANNVNISAKRFFSFVPILGMAVPLVQTGLTGLGSRNLSANIDVISFGTEVLATAVASLAQHGPINQAEEIVKDAISILVSDKADTNSIIDAVIFSIQRAMEQRNLKDTYDPQTLRHEVTNIAGHFEAFYPLTIFATSLSAVPGINVRSVLDASASSTVNQLHSFITETYQKGGETRAIPPFILNIGKATALVAANALLGVLQNRGALIPTFAKHKELPDYIQRMSVNVAKKVVSDLLITQTTSTSSSVTVLEKLVELIVTEVAKEADSITGVTTTASVEAAQAVAERTRCFGALLPILATVTPSLIQGIISLISNFTGRRGLGDSDTNLQVIVLATVDTISENCGLLKSKSGGLITSDMTLELINLAIQNSRESQTTVEQAIRKAFQMSGIKGDVSDFSIRSVIIRATRIMNENPETASSKSVQDDLELEMIEPLATMLMQQRSIGLDIIIPLAVQRFGQIATTVSGKAAVCLSRNLVQSRAISPEATNSFVLLCMQNATDATINMYMSSQVGNGFTFVQKLLEITQSSVEKAVGQFVGANRESVDVVRVVSSICGAPDVSRKAGVLGGYEIVSKSMNAMRHITAGDESIDDNDVVRAATIRLVKEAVSLLVSSQPELKSDDARAQIVFKDVIENIVAEVNRPDFISRLAVPRPQDVLEQLLSTQLTQSLNRNKVDVPSDLTSHSRRVLDEFYTLFPIPTLVKSQHGGVFDILSPMVSPLATGVVHELSQAAVFSAAGGAPTERSISAISPFVLLLAKSVAEVAAQSFLEVVRQLSTNYSSVTISSVLSVVVRNAAKKVLELTTGFNATAAVGDDYWIKILLPGAQVAARSLGLSPLTTVLPYIVEIVAQGVSSLPNVSTGRRGEPLTRDVRFNVVESVKTSSSRFLSPLLLGVASPIFAAKRTINQSLSETNEITSVGSDAAAAIAFIIATQEADARGSIADNLAAEAAAAFQRNTNKIVMDDWSVQRLEDEVTNAVSQAVTASGKMRSKDMTELRTIVNANMPQFIAVLPTSVPVCGTQHSKEDLLAKVDQQVVSSFGIDGGYEFTRTIARGAAQVAAGATVDTLASLHRASTPGFSSDQILKTAIDVGVKTATVVLSSFSNQRAASTENVVLSEILTSCLPIIHENVMAVSGQSNIREVDASTVTCLADNTRFFGSLMPILSTVAPVLINTIGNVISGNKSISGISYKASEAAAITTATIMLESRGPQDVNNAMIESAVRNCVDRLATMGASTTGNMAAMPLEDVMRVVEQVLQGAGVFQMVSKHDIEGRLRTVGDCVNIPWSKMNTPWTHLGHSSMSGTTGGLPHTQPHVGYPDQVEKMAMQVLQMYNGSQYYREDLSKAAVLRAIDAVLTFPRLNGFPDTFVCELAKTAGNITAKEMMHQNADSHRAVTLGLAVVAQLLTPSDIPRGVCVGGIRQAF